MARFARDGALRAPSVGGNWVLGRATHNRHRERLKGMQVQSLTALPLPPLIPALREVRIAPVGYDLQTEGLLGLEVPEVNIAPVWS